MKVRTVASMSTLSLIASMSLMGVIAQQPAQASGAKFMCGTSQGYPATVALTSRGPVPVIRWSSSYFNTSGYSPQFRCNAVSAKFQQYYQNGMLNYLTTGWSNRQPVVCVAAQKGGSCAGVLFTLKPGSNPWLTLTRLMDVRVRASTPLNESTATPVNVTDGEYLDMKAFLDSAPTEVSTPSQSSTQPAKGLW
ncbi:MAG: COP23 domain-containing protein [Thermosynechococcaceae cyanobacterium]